MRLRSLVTGPGQYQGDENDAGDDKSWIPQWEISSARQGRKIESCLAAPLS